MTLAATATIYDDGTSTIQERAVRKVDRVPVSEFPHLDKRADKAFIPPILRKYPAKSLSAACSCLSIPISTTTIVVSRSATVTATTTLPVYDPSLFIDSHCLRLSGHTYDNTISKSRHDLVSASEEGDSDSDDHSHDQGMLSYVDY